MVFGCRGTLSCISIFNFLWIFSNKTNGFKRISILLIILFFASILSFIHSYRYETHAAYFLMHNRFWELAFGSLIFLYQSKDSYNKEFFKKIPAEIILLIIVVIMCSPNIYGMQNTIASVFLTGLLILCLKKGTILFNILTTNCFYQIGQFHILYIFALVGVVYYRYVRYNLVDNPNPNNSYILYFIIFKQIQKINQIL